MNRKPSKLKPAPSRKADHSSLPCLRAGSSHITGPRSKDEPHASLGRIKRGVPWRLGKMGECGDTATTIDMQPLQQMGPFPLLQE